MSLLFIKVTTRGLINKSYKKAQDCELLSISYIKINKYDPDKYYGNRVKTFYRKPDTFNSIDNEYYHGITIEECNSRGITINDILENLEKEIDCDYVVGHNIEFDINILLFEAYKNKYHMLESKLKTLNKFCIMNYGANICKIKSNEWSNNYKFPKLEELYNFLTHDNYTSGHRSEEDILLILDCFTSFKSLIKISP
jgi:DNA polymerase III epsilon subunit-like protein